MQARETEPHPAPAAPADEGAAEAALGETTPQLRDVLGPAEETARGMLEAEDALHLVRKRFEQAVDPEAQGELAAEALEHVERQLELTRERRRQLDSIEAKLWGRRNRLEAFLIRTRGSSWWHARAGQKPAPASIPSADDGNDESVEPVRPPSDTR
jgi:hypothetical protein